MAQFELIMPKMGESVAEATITQWLKEEGETIELEESVIEIATDKVDSEVPSPVEGTLVKKLFEVDDVVQVGQAVAIIETDGDAPAAAPTKEADIKKEDKPAPAAAASASTATPSAEANQEISSSDDRFYSPLVKNIAKEEGLSQAELDSIPGTGKDGRLTKNDLLDYLASGRKSAPAAASVSKPSAQAPVKQHQVPAVSVGGQDEIIEMDRMRKLIADHMVMSKQVSPHVTSMIEVDVTGIWNWRSKMKKTFMERDGEKITFTPIFIEAVVKAIKDFPMINVSVQGNSIVKRGNINVGMAAALPSGNLIVPVIHNADNNNLIGLTKKVNDLANRARANALKPDEIANGTFTITNVGTFGNVMGTPIINQPQVAILAVGAIKKKPAVIETPEGDTIGIRYMMYASLSYDHRVVDGALGGSFLRRFGDYLEQFDTKREF